MSWFDWVILVAVLFFAWRGFRTGLIVQVCDLIGSIIALFLAFRFFTAAGGFLQQWLKVSTSLTNLLGFLLICLGISGTISLLARSWQKKEKSVLVTLIDSWGGAFFGALKSLVLIAIFLLFFTILPKGVWEKTVAQSGLAQDIIRITPFFYQQFEKSIPSNMPRLILTPEGVQLNKVELDRIIKGTCIACGKKVKLVGYERRGLAFIPHLRCTGCGLESDGCLTFEGYHLFYKECPFAAEERHKKVECQFWSGQGEVIPLGTCPVCGRQAFSL